MSPLAKIVDAYGQPVEIKLERKALGFIERTLPVQDTPNEPPTAVAPPDAWARWRTM